LEGLASRRPGGEAGNVGEHDRGVRKVVGNWLRLERTELRFLIILVTRFCIILTARPIIKYAVHDLIADVSGE
jgi:hypothetical protein